MLTVFLSSISEDGRVDMPSTPLQATGDGGPPVIVEFQENNSATENATAYLTIVVEGNPAPQFRFYKVTRIDMTQKST